MRIDLDPRTTYMTQANWVGSAYRLLADLTVSERPGTSYQVEIHFAVVNHLYIYLLFSFVDLVET